MDFRVAMERVQLEMGAATDRSAWFVSALCLAWPDGHAEVFEGRVDGVCVWPPRGGQGFGYDPMFVPDGETQTYGELSPAFKHATSHRARAFALDGALASHGPEQLLDQILTADRCVKRIYELDEH